MDPDANLQEQERILASGARGPANRVRLHDLREELWRWLRRRGYEPRWSECPKAAVHFKEHGGSNVAGWKVTALLLCLLPAVAAAQQPRTVYTDTDPATGLHLQRPVAVQRAAPARVPSAETLAGLKAREYVPPPEWPVGPTETIAYTPRDWPLPPQRLTPLREHGDTLILSYGSRWGLPVYGPFTTGSRRGARDGGRR